MSIADDTMCMHYTLERLGGIKTQTDLQEFMEEIRYNIRVNDEHRELNPDGDMPDGSPNLFMLSQFSSVAISLT